MNAPRPSYVACLVRAISPAMLLVVVSMILLVQAVLELGSVTQRAQAINERVAAVRASVAADTVLLRQRDSGETPMRQTVAGLPVELERHADHFLITVAEAGSVGQIFSRQLAGAAPRAFSHARVAADPMTLKMMGDGYHESVSSWPQPSGQELAEARRVSEVRGFYRDSEIALQHLVAGTDRPDFVWRSGEAMSRSSAPILVVPGNLWIGSGSRPFECTLSSDLVLVVSGNLHLLRSLRVHGPGRLLLVCQADREAVVFADIDGSGGWSAGDQLRGGDAFSGPSEGSGSAYFGLPGMPCDIVCDAGVLVSGELHLTGLADVHGPLLLRHGITKLPSVASPAQEIGLRRPGPNQWIFRLGRDRIPGFAVSGPPRPGRLQYRLR